MRSLLTIVCFIIAFSLHAQDKNEQAIRKVLQQQTIEWNKGNIDSYMKGYWESDSLLFVGKNGPRYGYNATLQNYKKTYPDTASMGKLSFDILKMKPLAADSYFILGKWMLRRSFGNLSGYYTLILKKIGKEWVIVVDHSS